MMEIKKRSPHYHRLDDYELRFHLSTTQKLSKQTGPRHFSSVLLNLLTVRVAKEAP